MPARLRPTAPIAADAILVGDPGRALLLAQELLQQPKMSNHARGLWGYGGLTREGRELTIQATGMGGPSATVVLQDLAELGVRRVVRVGTCTALGDLGLGEMVVVTAAQAFRGSFRTDSVQKEPRNSVGPDPVLRALLEKALPSARAGSAVSLDTPHAPEGSSSRLADVSDMQTAALLAAATELGVSAAAVLIISARSGSEQLEDEELEEAAKRAGTAAAAALSP